ncbi:piggyBac transposable element-derived protein 2 [Nephila pilipes]|uniref:PiggyBac transposable element-derived protein 2 n=1 Tax=Nephila pilipes TaxID=299642 RepID=A0A8X6Q6L4_NEPPI|nr:piggyBac transposable element-derived protein 2 [Nephila pilipes]
MPIVHLLSVRSYWSNELGFPIIQNTLNRDQFEKIRKFIHFNENQKHLSRDDSNCDRLHKLRSTIDILNKYVASILFEQNLSIDEEMCVTKFRHYMKQYMLNKSYKWGFELFVHADISGYAYNFEVYSGQEYILKKLITEPDFGLSSNVFIRLSRRIPRSENHKLYFDNYYTALPLMVHLANTGIHTLGTVRRNRIPE